MWAFDPPAPKDEIPAMRGSLRPSITGCSQVLNDWLTTNGLLEKSICGFNCAECSDGTIC